MRIYDPLKQLRRNFNLKQLTILAKRYVLYDSAGGHNIVVKIQTEISLWKQVKLAFYEFSSVNCPRIGQSLKQLSKTSVRWCSQGNLIGSFLQMIIKVTVVEFILSFMLSVYSSEPLKENASEVWKLSFERRLILDIQKTCR